MNERLRRVGRGHIVYQTDWMAVSEYSVERDGVTGTYSIVDRPDSIVVIPLTPANRTILLKQFRFPTNESCWELPMGSINGNETAEAAACRELLEELGLLTTDLVSIGTHRPAPGLTPNHQGLRRSGGR